MRAGIVVNVTRADRRRLEAIVLDRSAPQKHVWRANIIIATADGCGTAEIMRRSGKSKPVVWRWQARFMAEGVDGLTRDKTRKPGKQPLSTVSPRRRAQPRWSMWSKILGFFGSCGRGLLHSRASQCCNQPLGSAREAMITAHSLVNRSARRRCSRSGSMAKFTAIRARSSSATRRLRPRLPRSDKVGLGLANCEWE